MDSSITVQPTSTFLSATTDNLTRKVNSLKKGYSGLTCLCNTGYGALIGFVCSTVNPCGPYLGPALAAGCVGACATVTTLMVTKSDDNRAIVNRKQPENAPDSTLAPVVTESAPDSTLAPVKTEQAPVVLTYA